MLVLVMGGSGSGKSAYAEKRFCELAKENKYYLATMQVYGEESMKKVQRHHELRAGKGMKTIEQKIDLSKALFEMEDAVNSSFILECMSNLLANEMFREEKIIPENEVVEKVVCELKKIICGTKHQVIVTNKVFEDGIKYEETTLSYMRALGRVNQALAEIADEVVEVVVGIPIMIK